MLLCVFLLLKRLLVPGVSDRTLVDPIQPQLSPGVFTVKMETAYPGVLLTPILYRHSLNVYCVSRKYMNIVCIYNK